jgi:dienelactone hydrolase
VNLIPLTDDAELTDRATRSANPTDRVRGKRRQRARRDVPDASTAHATSSRPPIRALYLNVDGVDPVFGLLHMPAAHERRDTAVLICPPFGWDDICSYRSRRDWAEHLAASGYPALRVDLPGTGDSGGSLEDPGLLETWTVALDTAADWLGATTCARRIAAIGIGLGGLLLCRAAAQDAPIDDLVLWAVPSRGSTFVRELRAFGKMEASKYRSSPDLQRSVPPKDCVSAGGFLLSAETTRALQELDLAQLSLPDREGRRVLLLERDGIGVDDALERHLRDACVPVTIGPGGGYGAMMAEPQEARSPSGVFAQVESWLDSAGPVGKRQSPVGLQAAPGRAAPSKRRSVEARDTVELAVAGVRISETPVVIEQPFGLMFGVLAEPLQTPRADIGAVLLNAGAIRRIGPNRMWVRTARRWAARGVPSLRLDFDGLGDASGDGERFGNLAELYVPELLEQTRAALDELERRCEVHRFVLVGHCSGAFWSFHGALRDERVVAAFMVNPRTFFWHAWQATLRNVRRGLLLPSSWRLIARGHVRPARIATVVRHTPRSLLGKALAGRRSPRESDELALALDTLSGAGKRLHMVFSEGEPLHEELERQGRLRQAEHWPNLTLQLIPGRDHALRPLYSQRDAERALDQALDSELSPVIRGHPPA